MRLGFSVRQRLVALGIDKFNSDEAVHDLLDMYANQMELIAMLRSAVGLKVGDGVSLLAVVKELAEPK